MSSPGAPDLPAVLSFTIALAHTAGALMLEGQRAILTASSSAVDEKKNSVDLVTEYDVRVEELVKSELKKQYPGYGFIGEESFAAGARPPLTDVPTFCVDPIDGTTNFVHAFPFSCISLALLYKKQPVLGVVYSPFLRRLYYATRGGGAWMELTDTNERVQLPIGGARPLRGLNEALLGIEWGSDRSPAAMQAKCASFTKLGGDAAAGGRMAHGLRSLGSAALNYAMVSQGGLDMYWEIGCWPWDIAAGAIIAQEAGGFVAGGKGAPLDNVVGEDVLLGRKYIVFRAVADTETEKGVDAQKRLIKEFYDAVEDYEPN
ncbi:hypothetical protein CERSUDRAFT_120080 [Gelatoporia subvermispora B]|uniref:Inositol-1-monophosphatase n=1 Tax=Ceriporiopsis subvermispora (strain B) TaxID=914234 RepID=M2QGF1_CERS8|nr:hypothetical protein CERSUDRAFT_120080 [Gelatoporia subvermispora B]